MLGGALSTGQNKERIYHSSDYPADLEVLVSAILALTDHRMGIKVKYSDVLFTIQNASQNLQMTDEDLMKIVRKANLARAIQYSVQSNVIMLALEPPRQSTHLSSHTVRRAWTLA